MKTILPSVVNGYTIEPNANRINVSEPEVQS
jgi:hypothetical protein